MIEKNKESPKKIIPKEEEGEYHEIEKVDSIVDELIPIAAKFAIIKM